MISQAKFYGGSKRVTSFASVVVLHPDIARAWILHATAGGAVARFPDSVFGCPHLIEGGPHIYAANTGSQPIEIQTLDGAAIDDLPAGSSLIAYLVDRDGDDADQWRIEIRAVL